MIGPEQKRLEDRLFGDPNRKTLNFQITPGERRVSAEELCGEINRALDDVESGRAKEVGPVDSEKPRMSVTEWLKQL